MTSCRAVSVFGACLLCVVACGDTESTIPGGTGGSSSSAAGLAGGGLAGGGAGGATGGASVGGGLFDGPCESQPVAEAPDTQTSQVGDSAFLYSTPTSPAGLLLMFHGGGGSKEDNLIDRIDPVLIAREALARGYTVASLDSVAHVVPNGNNTYQWDDDDSATNVDVVNVEAMIARLTDPDDLNAAPAGGPLVLVGISNGGSMASRVAQRVSIDAAVIYISNAVAFHDSGATIPPLVLVPGANDPGQALASNKTLRDSVEADGGDVLYIVNESDALTPGLFMRVDGVSCEMSKSIGLGLEAAQWLNADGTLANNPKSDHSWQSALPEAVAQYKFQISDVLVEAYAEHAPSSDQNAQVFDFLADLQ